MIRFPFETPPAPGEVIEVSAGVLWARFALPFRLDHVNVYFLRDDDGWVVVDTGISNPETKAAWEALLAGPLQGEKIAAVLATHHHPDHIGLAGWLCEKLEAPLLTSTTSFLSCMNFYNSPEFLAATEYMRFYASHGMPDEVAALVSTQGHQYMRMLSQPPASYRRLYDGMVLKIGGRDFHVLTGDGHSAEQAMLYQPEAGLFLAADQVIEKISPNISVPAYEPQGNPLGAFLSSLGRIARDVPDEVLVLAGHRLPFHGLHERTKALIDHHDERCELIVEACRTQAVSATDLVPVLFHRELSPHEMSFAFSETLAHLNYLVAEGKVMWEQDATGHLRARTL
ncbi:MBL fold metallo-hydrolase [uncultured Roseibium sp.]|uniref:MBL fold metallo-hydrolase n=1 Tax=uncultured Roseibium sp. TaxID=1936171 RepID=UPI003217E64A